MNRRRFAALAASALLWPAVRPWNAARAAAEAGEDEELAELSIDQASVRLRASSLSSRRLTEACLARIGIYEPKLNAFITVLQEAALARAAAMDAELAAGHWRGPLHGIPLALKDLIDTAGTKTTGGSSLFADRIPTEDATVVTRLKAAGAVILGKTNLFEFGSQTSYFGLSRNPWDLTRTTGGSSSGNGAAVSAALCYGALGSDTGGSVRIPASYCGLVGLKATYGLVPLRGILPCVVSLDHCGPMTRTVTDAALLLNQIAGYDPLDFTSGEHPREDYVAALRQPVAGLRLGLPASFFDQLDPEVAAAVAEALGVLRRMTRGTKEVELPATAATGMDGGGVGIGAEFYAFQEEYFRKNPGGYMPPERRRIEAWASAHGGYASDYARGLWALQRLRRTIDQTFADVDLLVLPTQRILPPTNADYLRDVYDATPRPAPVTSNCPPFNIYGIPALSLTCGFSRNGLPIGLMIAGPRFAEGRVLALARAYEQATPWRLRRPPLAPATPVPA